ncbi:hypothetical protein I532_22120 [Brevibacillus borstelensis AK1]|uniref:Uncharacterized protein n=1 Tax=Brevibacillus borstelensis AK1 TaxID=1300222 RepID=M8DAM6_9BACL|nr:hypothetical protein [Brevibacillus borstelensis]EMT50433.1 hypothetical protein I532_22120 [Brevibacillus borstelensis AK1]
MNIYSLIIKFFGIAFLIIGFLKIGGFIKIEFKNIFSLSLAGFLFILFDFVSYLVTKSNKRKLKNTLGYLRLVTLFLSIVTIIVVPFMPIKWNTPFLKVITDSLVYLSLGIVIYLMGSKDTNDKESNISKLEKQN